MDIEYVEAESAPEKERQVEIAIAEVVGGGEVEFGQTIAYDCAVGFVRQRHLDNITIFVIYHPFASVIYTGITPHVEVAHRLSHFNTLKIIT